TFGARANASQSSLCRFLHHVAEFSCQRYATTPFDECGFDLKNFAADFSPCKPGCETNLTVSADALLAKLDRTQHFANAFRVNYVLRIFSRRFGNKLTRELTT